MSVQCPRLRKKRSDNRLKKGDPGAPGVFLVPVPLFQRPAFPFKPVAFAIGIIPCRDRNQFVLEPT